MSETILYAESSLAINCASLKKNLTKKATTKAPFFAARFREEIRISTGTSYKYGI
jgi:hypothetical protein